MLRRQRSLTALIQPPPEVEEEEYPPPPTGLTRATLRIKTLPTPAPTGTPGKKGLLSTETPVGHPKDGLIHRVSSLFRNTSATAKLGSPSSSQYKATASNSEIHVVAGGKLVKRPSARRNTTAATQPEKDRLREVAVTPQKKTAKSVKSSKSTMSISSTFGFKSNSSTAKTTPASPGHKSLPNTTSRDELEDDEDDIRRPSDLGRTSSLRSTNSPLDSEAFVEADVSGATPQAKAFPNLSEDEDEDDEEDIRRPSGLGRASSMRSLLEDSPEADELASNPLENYPRSRTRSSPAGTLTHLHQMLGLAPPLLPVNRIASTVTPSIWHAIFKYLSLSDSSRCCLVSKTMLSREKTRSRLADSIRSPHLAALVQGVICLGWPSLGFEQLQLSSLRSLTVFSPQTMPPLDFLSLSTFLREHRTLERLAIIGDTASDEQVLSENPDTSYVPFLPNLTHLHAPPAITCVLLERMATSPPTLPALPTVIETPRKRLLSAEALALLSPDAPSPKQGGVVELKRPVSINLTRTSYVPASPGSNPPTPPHPLRVLRIAMPRPLYETISSGAVGGARIGRAIASLLARGGQSNVTSKRELALHIMLGPRVDKRTMEKVLRTIGTGIKDGLDPVKVSGSLALLEVRSCVRVTDLYRTITTIIPRYPTLRTLLLTRLTRPSITIAAESTPPSPASSTFYFPSPPPTPGFASSSLRPPPSPSFSIHPPPSPSFAAAQALPLPPSPPIQTLSPSPSSIYASAPSTPTSLAPATPNYRRSSIQLLPPGLLPPLSPHGSTFSRQTATKPTWTWEWDGWQDAGDVLNDAGINHWDDERERLYLDDAVIDSFGYDAESSSDFAGLDDPDVTDVISREDALRVAVWRRHCPPLERVRMVSGAWWVNDD
ncbi:hypothetical protein MIND_00529200 [Mycena indigotica]|uniref:Uncharacterized protein n=1 Tax=Mycena indigotica TaxID=2126181 RepID=A0A8H6W761_9AGAR|nr:uncharacterized protein MIND_00529200 [Mycena indigotica]KAF7307352.1 hypothetical protein MIND_00529200 [Mycena indigotica]